MSVIQLKPFALLFVLAVIIPIAGSEIILLIAHLGMTNWAAAAVFHSVLALFVFTTFALNPHLRFSKQNCLPLLEKHPSLAYLPALLVLVISVLLVLFKAETPYRFEHFSLKSFATVLLVPVVEEVCYRLGLSRLFSSIGGRIWGGYFSALVFTTMHSLPSVERIINQEIGFFFGPFLLALFCELIFGWSKQLFPAILLHMACNSTGVIFSMAGGYWLNFFRFFYH